MPAMAALSGQAYSIGMRGTEIEQGLECLPAQVRLVPQHNCPVGQESVPSGPLCSALNRTEHAAFRSGIDDPIARRKAEAIEFSLDRKITRRAHDCDLFGLKKLPLVDQVAEHGGFTPRQQQLGPAHARGTTGGEQDGGESEGHCERVTELPRFMVA